MSTGMLEYFVAGPADDEDYAQAEYLAELLMVSLPTIKCSLFPILPNNWNEYVMQKCSYLGCKQRAPLIWMNSGTVVGGLPEFAAECEKKYNVVVKGVDYDTWSKVAAENLAAAEKAAAGRAEVAIGSVGSGAECGLAITEELLAGNRRHLGEPLALLAGSTGSGAGGGATLADPAATVLALTPLPAAAHTLLGCAEENLFVVPCTPVGIEELAVGNAEFGAISLKTKAVILLAAPTPELPTLLQAAKDARLGKDAPLPTSQAALLERMLPALTRTLAVAPSRCTPAELERLCLEEWVRENADELLRQSPVLSELSARDGIHVERAVCSAEGALVLV
jgi:hypothetical protein